MTAPQETRAHRLRRMTGRDPRLYFLDRFTVDGRIHVGYIGQHLTNTPDELTYLAVRHPSPARQGSSLSRTNATIVT